MIPSLRTFTTGLYELHKYSSGSAVRANDTYRLTGRDGKDLRRVTNRALDAELLVLCTVDEVRGD